MHHTIFLCFALLIPLVFLGGCAPSASDAYHKITPQAGYEMMKKEPVTLIDVREPAEYQQGHIPGATHPHTKQANSIKFTNQTRK